LVLPLLADLIQEEVAAVALDLIRREGNLLHDRQTRLRPLGVPALEIDHVLVAELLELLGREDGAKPGLAVEHHRRLRIRDRAADAELEEAAADIGGGLD